jgi:hypothetical protein
MGHRVDPREGALLLAALMVPTLIMGVARFLPSGPAPAGATEWSDEEEGGADLPSPHAGEARLSPAQARMRRAAERVPGSPPSPFHVEAGVGRASDAVFEPVSNHAAPAAGPAIPPGRVTAIIAGRRTIAVINGRPFAEGDGLGEGWSVESIHADRQSVVLRHAVFGRATLTLREP